MKKLFILCYVLTCCLFIQAQSPQQLNYQAVVRGANGVPLPNGTIVLFRFTIHDGSPTGMAVYTEVQTDTTNQFGLVNTQIGSVTSLSGINWGGGTTKYMQVETDINNTGTFTDMGTTQLVSVPYSLYSQNTASVSGLLNYVSRFFPDGKTIGISQIYDDGTYVGVGNSSPANKFEIGSATGFSGNDFAIGNNGKGMSFFQAADATYWYSNTSFSIMGYGGGNGYVGVGNSSPANKLEIGTATGFSGNDLAIGNGTKAMSFYQSNTASTWYSSTNFSLMPNTGNGYVGIGTQSPTNKLQIGAYTNNNYGGNQLAFGSGGTNVTVMNQATSVFNFQSNNTINIQAQHSIYLMPNNGAGNVGINTNAPMAPLEVDSYDALSYPSYPTALCGDPGYAYFKADNPNAGVGCQASSGFCNSCTGKVSIYATNNVMAAEFDAMSDLRIKNVKGLSNSANDLETLSHINITDYTMKDIVKYGDRPFKKVIAQQIERVYPQVVLREPNYIPNVYRVANRISKTSNGYLIEFNTPHGISCSAKRLQVMDANGVHRLEVVDIPDANTVTVTGGIIQEGAFVYGEMVNDFRTVDYEGLTTLNISATQQLYKQIQSLEKQNEELRGILKATNEQQQIMKNDLDALKQVVLQHSERSK